VSNVIIVAKDSNTAARIRSELSASKLDCSLAVYSDKLVEKVIRELPELILLDIKGPAGLTALRELTDGNRIQRKVPVVGLIDPELLDSPAYFSGLDDFIVSPFVSQELQLRVARLMRKNVTQDEVINCGDMMIDLSNCEVRVAGKVVELTFKEYELLKFLARDRGRVFSREILLNKVWGYDYFGGDRTVDVHIRRLRSKIEIGGRSFVETVRNIGYRFKKDLS
jgi:two-component system, OmpR family, alkaline phosphatase synthesis response regulator PhoP